MSEDSRGENLSTEQLKTLSDIEQKMCHALAKLKNTKKYEENKKYYKCILPVDKNVECGYVSTFSDITNHMNEHWQVSYGACNRCNKLIYNPADIWTHDPNCDGRKYSNHNPSKDLATHVWRARNAFIKAISRGEWLRNKAKNNEVKRRNVTMTPTYEDPEEDERGAAAESREPEEREEFSGDEDDDLYSSMPIETNGRGRQSRQSQGSSNGTSNGGHPPPAPPPQREIPPATRTVRPLPVNDNAPGPSQRSVYHNPSPAPSTYPQTLPDPRRSTPTPTNGATGSSSYSQFLPDPRIARNSPTPTNGSAAPPTYSAPASYPQAPPDPRRYTPAPTNGSAAPATNPAGSSPYSQFPPDPRRYAPAPTNGSAAPSGYPPGAPYYPPTNGTTTAAPPTNPAGYSSSFYPPGLPDPSRYTPIPTNGSAAPPGSSSYSQFPPDLRKYEPHPTNGSAAPSAYPPGASSHPPGPPDPRSYAPTPTNGSAAPSGYGPGAPSYPPGLPNPRRNTPTPTNGAAGSSSPYSQFPPSRTGNAPTPPPQFFNAMPHSIPPPTGPPPPPAGPSPVSFRLNTHRAPIQQVPLSHIISPNLFPLDNSHPPPLLPTVGDRSRPATRNDNGYRGPITRSRTPVRHDSKDDAPAPVGRQGQQSVGREQRSSADAQNVARRSGPPPGVSRNQSRGPPDDTPPMPPHSASRKRQGTAVGDEPPVQRPPQNVARRSGPPPGGVPRSSSRGAESPPLTRSRAASAVRNDSPLQQQPAAPRAAPRPPMRVTRSVSRPRDNSPIQSAPQPIRRRTMSTAREDRQSVDAIAQEAGLTRSRPARAPTPTRTEPEEQAAPGTVSIAVVTPGQMRRQTTRRSVSYGHRSLSRGRAEEGDRAERERLERARESEQVQGSGTVRVPPNRNRMVIFSNPSAAVEEPPKEPPKKTRPSRQERSKSLKSKGIAPDNVFAALHGAIASQQPSTTYDLRGNLQQPSTSNAGHQRQNPRGSSPPPAPAQEPRRSERRSRSRSNTRSSSRSQSPYSQQTRRSEDSRGNRRQDNNRDHRRNDNHRHGGNNSNKNYRKY